MPKKDISIFIEHPNWKEEIEFRATIDVDVWNKLQRDWTEVQVETSESRPVPELSQMSVIAWIDNEEDYFLSSKNEEDENDTCQVDGHCSCVSSGRSTRCCYCDHGGNRCMSLI